MEVRWRRNSSRAGPVVVRYMSPMPPRSRTRRRSPIMPRHHHPVHMRLVLHRTIHTPNKGTTTITEGVNTRTCRLPANGDHHHLLLITIIIRLMGVMAWKEDMTAIPVDLEKFSFPRQPLLLMQDAKSRTRTSAYNSFIIIALKIPSSCLLPIPAF